MTRFARGDKVEWNTSQGPTGGTVVGQVAREAHVGGFTAAATPAHPEVKVRSATSGKTAIHRPEALRKKAG